MGLKAAPESARHSTEACAPASEDPFVTQLDELFRWRRDVRRFRTQSVPDALATEVLGSVRYAPSVGLSEPTRLLRIETERLRAAVRDNFAACNADGLAGYTGDRAKLYAGLKLAGLEEAPVQVAVFADMATPKGGGLGCRTMPETLAYSAVCAVMLMWCAAQARGLGLGWVSILDPAKLAATLETPDDWKFVAYLCLGWPEEHHLDPELERAGWQDRSADPHIEVR